MNGSYGDKVAALRGWEVAGSCLVTGMRISGFEPLGFAT